MMILSMFPMSAFTIDVIICGMAFTIVVMMVGRFSIRATSRRTPASISCGILPRTAVRMPSMICGIAATIAVIISGRAVISEVRS